MIYEKTKGYLKAEYVKLSDELQVLVDINGTFSFSKVISIVEKFENGFIAPLTESGNFLVNGIHSSCYDGVNSHKLTHLFLKPLVFWYQIKKSLQLAQSEPQLTPETSIYHPYLAYLKFSGIKQLLADVSF